MYCGKCGAKVKESNKYCIYCGAELGKQAIEEQKTLESKEQSIEKEETERNFKVRKEQSNLNDLYSNYNSKSNKKASTIWLNLITAWWFMIGTYNALWGLLSLFDENTHNSFIALLYLIIGSLQMATFFCVYSRKVSGYYLFLITTWSSLFVNNVIKFLFLASSEANDYSIIVFTEIVAAIVFCIPNSLYINKRKSLFGIEDNEEEF